MSRARVRVPSLHRVSAWILAASGLVLYGWAPLVAPGEALRSPGSLPWWVPWIAPPLLYGLLLVGLPGLTAVRRVSGTAALCALHAGLMLAVPRVVAVLGVADPVPWAGSLWGFPAAPIVQLLAVPLVAFPLRDLLVPPSRRGRFAAERLPTPSPLRTGRGWDDAGTHTVGGERLREAPIGGEATPDWRRDPRDPIPPRFVPGSPGRGPGGTDATPPPSKLAARTPTPPRFAVKAPAPEPTPAVPSLTIDAEIAPAPAPARVEPTPAVPSLTIDTDVAPPPASDLRTMDTAPLVREVPAAPEPAPAPLAPPPASDLRTMDTAPLVREPVAAPPPPPPLPAQAAAAPGLAEPVLVEPGPPAVRVPDRPLASEPVLRPSAAPIAEPAPPAPQALPTVEPAQIARILAPVGPLEIEHQVLMGIGLYTACGSHLARAVVTNAAFRALAFLVEAPTAEPVTQTTLRGAAGALVVTPLGPRPGVGPVLAVAIPQRGALALLEILALRVAAASRATHAAEPAPPATSAAPAGVFREAPVPARVGALARSLVAGGTLRPLCLEDATGDLTLHLLLEPGADAERLGRLATSLYRIMEMEAEPGGIGPVHSVVVRLGRQRVVVQPVAPADGRATLLVAATAADHRPGLTRLQLERVAARLGGAPA